MRKFSCLFLLLNFVLLPVAQAGVQSIDRQTVISQRLSDGTYSQEQALVYRVMSLKTPELLPEDLQKLPNKKIKSATPLMVDVFNALQSGKLSAEHRQYLEKESRRPTSIGHYDSEIYPLRVHYANLANSSIAKDVLAYAEYSWKVETEEMGFLAPLTDDGDEDSLLGGNNFLDIYLDNTGYEAAGFTRPEKWNEATPQADCQTYIVISPSTSSILATTVAHEMNHSMQMAYDCIENHSFMENTATYIMHLVYPDEVDFIQYLADFQSVPQFGFDYFADDTTFHYGAFLVPLLLDELYGKGDGSFVRSIWERCMQNSENENEPDYFDAIAAAIKEKNGASFDDFQTQLTEWRYFIGSQDDGKHFKNITNWLNKVGVSGRVAFDKHVYLDRTSGIIEGKNSIQVFQHGSSYVDIELPEGVDAGIAVNFSATASRWNAQLLCQKYDNDSKIFPLRMYNDMSGTITVDNDNYKDCVLAVTNLGDKDYDPDINHNTVSYDYNYQIAMVPEDLVVPKVTSLSANLMNCSGKQDFTITGENFFVGMEVLIGDKHANIVELKNDSLKIMVPSMEISGLYDLQISTPGGEKIKVQELLFMGEGCSCSCDTSEACESNCDCDPHCLYCECDVDTNCSSGCPCDPECKAGSGCNCNAATADGQKSDMYGFLVLALILGGYFTVSRRLNNQRTGRD